MGDMNATIGNQSKDEMVGKWEVPRWNKNSSVDECTKWGLFFSKYLF